MKAMDYIAAALEESGAVVTSEDLASEDVTCPNCGAAARVEL